MKNFVICPFRYFRNDFHLNLSEISSPIPATSNREKSPSPPRIDQTVGEFNASEFQESTDEVVKDDTVEEQTLVEDEVPIRKNAANRVRSGRVAKDKSNLTVTISGVLYFPCEVCNKTFTSNSGRSRHKCSQNHNNTTIVIRCNICNKTFTTSAGRTKHMKIKHNNVADSSVASKNLTDPGTGNSGSLAETDRSTSSTGESSEKNQSKSNEKNQSKDREGGGSTSSTSKSRGKNQSNIQEKNRSKNQSNINMHEKNRSKNQEGGGSTSSTSQSHEKSQSLSNTQDKNTKRGQDKNKGKSNEKNMSSQEKNLPENSLLSISHTGLRVSTRKRVADKPKDMSLSASCSTGANSGIPQSDGRRMTTRSKRSRRSLSRHRNSGSAKK